MNLWTFKTVTSVYFWSGLWATINVFWRQANSGKFISVYCNGGCHYCYLEIIIFCTSSNDLIDPEPYSTMVEIQISESRKKLTPSLSLIFSLLLSLIHMWRPLNQQLSRSQLLSFWGDSVYLCILIPLKEVLSCS